MSEKNILDSWTNFKKINADKLSKNNASEEYNKKYPTTKFKDFTRGQKDEVHKAMKNPNWQNGFLTKDSTGKNKWIDKNTGEEKMGCTICGAESPYHKSKKCYKCGRW